MLRFWLVVQTWLTWFWGVWTTVTITFEGFSDHQAGGGAEQSTAVVRLLEEALKTDLRAPGFPAEL